MVAAARIMLEKRNLSVDEALGDREHPLALVLRTVEHLGEAWARDGLDQPVSTIAAALGSIALGYSQCAERLVDSDFPIAMTAIMRSCVRHHREIALYDFLANKRAALERLSDASAERALGFWAASIEEEIKLCANSHLVDAGRCVVSELDVLVGATAAGQIDPTFVGRLLASAQQFFDAAAISQLPQAFEHGTLRDAIQATRRRLQQSQTDTG